MKAPPSELEAGLHPKAQDFQPLPPSALELENAQLRERLRRAELRLHGLQELGQILASDPNLSTVLDEIIRRTTQLLECERATLYLVGEDRVTLWSQVSNGELTHTIELKKGQGIAGWVAEHGRTVNVKDAYRDPRFDARFDLATGWRTRSMLCQPLRDPQQRLLGVIQAMNKRPGEFRGQPGSARPSAEVETDGYFTPTDEDLLETIASQAAVLIRGSRLYLDLVAKNIQLLDTKISLQERTKEIELMFAVERSAAVSRTLDQALDGALRVTMAEYPSELAAVLLLRPSEPDEPPDPQTRWVVARAAGPSAERVQRLAGRAGEPVLAEALLASRATRIAGADLQRDALPPLIAEHPGPIQTVAVLPIVWRGEAPAGFEHDDPGIEPGDSGYPQGALVLINPRAARGHMGDIEARDLTKLGLIATRMALSATLAGALEEERRAERMAAVGGALSGIVHDLRTPLTVLGGVARLMVKEDDAERRAALRDDHKKQIAHIQTMIHDVLAFAKGTSEVLPRKVFAREFMHDLEEILRLDLDGTPVTLVMQVDFRGALRIDDAKMKRVVMNLARNAREAMGEHGGELRIALREDGDFVVLSVSDTGPGIPKEMEGRLFQSFATHGKANGTGLGLAIVKTIVDQHEGTLTVSSEPGRGTTFAIGLPAA